MPSDRPCPDGLASGASLNAIRTAVTGAMSGVPVKDAYLQVKVPNPELLVAGANVLEVEVTSLDVLSRSIVEINLGARFDYP